MYPNSTVLCVPCHSLCSECWGSGPSQCLSCSPNYFYQAGTCAPLCPSHQYYDSACQPCHDDCGECDGPTASHCLTCPEGAKLSSLDNTCTTELCPPSTYDTGLECKACAPLCLVCTTAALCTQCDLTAAVFYSHSCLAACPAGTYLLQQTGPYDSCAPCQDRCASCDSASNCVLCASGHYLVGGSCLSYCAAGYPDALTRTCLPCDDAACLRCATST